MQDPGILLTIIMGAGSALSGAVVILFKIVMKQNTEQIKLSEKVGHLEGKQDGIKTLSEDVLQAVHNAVKDKNNTFQDQGPRG